MILLGRDVSNICLACCGWVRYIPPTNEVKRAVRPKMVPPKKARCLTGILRRGKLKWFGEEMGKLELSEDLW